MLKGTLWGEQPHLHSALWNKNRIVKGEKTGLVLVVFWFFFFPPFYIKRKLEA